LSESTKESLTQSDIVQLGVSVSRLFKCLQDLILVIAYSPPSMRLLIGIKVKLSEKSLIA
jgi:hypothetical protein